MPDTKSLIPTFIVYFDGTRLTAEREADVKEVIVTDHIDSPSTFNLIVADQEQASNARTSRTRWLLWEKPHAPFMPQ